jgi:putative ABC transport system substrate-binding protein
MRRREFLTGLGGTAALPFAAHAQQAVRSVGLLMALAEGDEARARIATFRRELEKFGWLEGRNLRIDIRFGAGKRDQYQHLAKELVELQPDAILGQSTPVIATLQRETRTIPIVFVNVSDPIGTGFVASLARPGGNITGVLLYETGIIGKWLAMLREIAPHLTRAAILGNPQTTAFDYFLRAAEAAASPLKIELVPGRVGNSTADIERTIKSFAPVPNGGLLVLPDPTNVAHRDLIITLAAQHKLPAVYPFRLYVTAGGLMSYETDQLELFGQAATYVDRILHGVKPIDLPVRSPTKYATALNIKTAKAISLDVPPSLLVRADEVIE